VLPRPAGCALGCHQLLPRSLVTRMRSEPRVRCDGCAGIARARHPRNNLPPCRVTCIDPMTPLPSTRTRRPNHLRPTRERCLPPCRRCLQAARSRMNCGLSWGLWCSWLEARRAWCVPPPAPSAPIVSPLSPTHASLTPPSASLATLCASTPLSQFSGLRFSAKDPLKNSAFLDGRVPQSTNAVCCPANPPPRTRGTHATLCPPPLLLPRVCRAFNYHDSAFSCLFWQYLCEIDPMCRAKLAWGEASLPMRWGAPSTLKSDPPTRNPRASCHIPYTTKTHAWPSRTHARTPGAHASPPLALLSLRTTDGRGHDTGRQVRSVAPDGRCMVQTVRPPPLNSKDPFQTPVEI
jgi:hypothetical protein